MCIIKKLVILSFFILIINQLKSVKCQVCKIIVDDCNDNDICSTGCESMCHRNFGVCVMNKGLFYCHCFNTESRKNWHNEFRNKFKQLREEIVKEDLEEIKRQNDLLEMELNNEEEDDQESKEFKKNNAKTKKLEHSDL